MVIKINFYPNGSKKYYTFEILREIKMGNSRILNFKMLYSLSRSSI